MSDGKESAVQPPQVSNQFATDEVEPPKYDWKPENPDQREWLIKQLRRWPDRVDERYTCSQRFLMDAAANVLTQAGDPRLREALEQIRGIDDGAEINTLNYNHDAVERLNNAFVECVLIADRALATPSHAVLTSSPSVGLAADVPSIECVACEGRPIYPNDPCEVCGGTSKLYPLSPVAESNGGGVEHLARRLCNDQDARELAGATEQPSYDDSSPDVQLYWQTIASTALQADPGQSGEGK